MVFNELTAQSESARRNAFVSEGAQTARLLQGWASRAVRSCANRVVCAAGKALTATGAWLQRAKQLGSARS